MKLYRCDLCGRVFNQKTPHKCYGGSFRKLSLTYTEFDDDDFEYVKKPKIVPQGALILQERAEPKIEFMVNWKQARVDASIAIAQGFASNNNIFGLSEDEIDEQEAKRRLAKVSVSFADALIAELKRKDDGELKRKDDGEEV